MRRLVERRHSLVFAVCFSCFLCSPCFGEQECVEIPQRTPSNRRVVISDLHLGPGCVESGGRWSPLEDFRFAELFEGFLKHIADAGGTDLIIAGDFVDFWQILPEREATRPPDLGSTEVDSLAKLDVALRAHRRTFSALAEFASKGTNRLIIIPGNHDVDLAWPAVQERLRKELTLNRERLYFTNPCFRSEGLHVEHGHQSDEANRFVDPAAPWTTVDGTKRLETNWGTVFMSRFYNQLEGKRPFIDNLYPESASAVLALKNEPALDFSMPQAGRLFVMLSRDQRALDNLGFLIRTLGPTEQPRDVPEKTVDNFVKLYREADGALGDVLDSVIAKEKNRSELAADLERMSADEWRYLHAGIVRKPRTLRAAVRQDAYLDAARKIALKEPNIRVVVMGHTHEIDRVEVTELSKSREQQWYVNTGCWQKSLSVREARERTAWSALDLDDDSIFRPRFSYVEVETRNGRPTKPARAFWPR